MSTSRLSRIHQTSIPSFSVGPLIGCFLGPFVRFERRKRKDTVLRRLKKGVTDGRISKKVLENTRRHMRRQSSTTTGSLRLRSAWSSLVPLQERGLPELDTDASTGASSGASPGDGRSATSPRREVYEDARSQSVLADEDGEGRALRGIITQYELTDPSAVIARKIAGYVDLGMSIFLPVAYTVFVAVVLTLHAGSVGFHSFESTTNGDFKGTRITHSHDGVTESACCF